MFARLAPLILFVLPVLANTRTADLCNADELPMCCEDATLETTNLLRGIEATLLNVISGKEVQCTSIVTDEVGPIPCRGRGKLACCSRKSLYSYGKAECVDEEIRHRLNFLDNL